ncbi:MAG: pseudouridine synthase [Propioniciclava sp.]
MLAAGRFVFGDGTALTGAEPYRPHTFVWFHRDLRPEPERDWELPLLYRDDRIVVLDKPAHLATIPRGRHVTQSAVVLLRRQLSLPDLSPAHRLDRLTSGVLLFTVEQRWRRPYQQVFEQGAAYKLYEALAPIRPDLEFPRTVRSHIAKIRGELQARELAGKPANAETSIDLVEARGRYGRYRLVPRTGRTHQLRVHLSALGMPILGDPLYPAIADGDDDLSGDLQLVARQLRFSDPVDGTPREFISERPLIWPS